MAERKKLPSDPKAMEIMQQLVAQLVSDQQIREVLNDKVGYYWSLDAIRRTRRKYFGIDKTPGKTIEVSNEPALSLPPPGVLDADKARWFKDQFKQTHLHVTLKNQFDKNEIATYMEEYGSICCQFEDIVTSEFFQIDDFLKHRILINRQLTMMKSMQEEITESTKWLTQNRLEDLFDPEDKQERGDKVIRVSILRKELHKVNERYDKLVNEREKIYKNLAATRQDRIDELRKGGKDFFSLLIKLQNSEEERDRQGKYAELTRIAAEDIKKEFRQPIKFPDGEIAPIIMDAETEFDDE